MEPIIPDSPDAFYVDFWCEPDGDEVIDDEIAVARIKVAASEACSRKIYRTEFLRREGERRVVRVIFAHANAKETK